MSDQFIYGINAFDEAIRSGKSIEKLFLLKENLGPRLSKIKEEAKRLKIPVSVVPKVKFKGIGKKNHQGVVAMISPIQYASLENIIDDLFSKGVNPFLLAADSITDIRNIGAIARSAQAFGCHALLTPIKGGALLNAEAIKSSSGALLDLPVCRVEHMTKALEFVKNSGLRLISITEKSSSRIYGYDFSGPVALVMGSEGAGVSPEILKMSDENLAIPMSDETGVGSLNVSVAAGIACSEVFRSRREL